MRAQAATMTAARAEGSARLSALAVAQTLYERACAALARIARADTIYGGARALVLARRMERRKGSQVPANEIVSAVYSASNYSCGEWGAYECPECGTAHLGTEAAYRCCSQVEELQLACA
jgi:hypothetical protein